MWTIWKMARFRANELGIVKIEVFADSHPNKIRFYLVGLCRDDSGYLFSFGDRVECMLTGEKISLLTAWPIADRLLEFCVSIPKHPNTVGNWPAVWLMQNRPHSLNMTLCRMVVFLMLDRLVAINRNCCIIPLGGKSRDYKKPVLAMEGNSIAVCRFFLLANGVEFTLHNLATLVAAGLWPMARKFL